MSVIYNIIISFYYLLIKFISLFNTKAYKWINGRKTQSIPDLRQKKVIWMHCSSLGEYEQGKPLLDKLKVLNHNHIFVLSFFSPSGYEKVKKTGIADYILYLPIDLPSKSVDFITKINPSLVIFVKYDFWFNYLKHLNKSKINTVFISVILNKNHRLFNYLNKFIVDELKKVLRIFTQDSMTVQLLTKRGFSNATKSGDTRIERVLEISKSNYSDKIIENFICENKKTFICGSTWKKDIEVIAATMKNEFWKKYKVIIAPHEMGNGQTNHINHLFKNKKIAFYSKCDNENLASFDILVIDIIGILSKIYRYADLAYIGGGFGQGIHNTLEPAAYSIPVIFGPKYQKFNEANELIKAGSFFSAKNSQDLTKILLSLETKEILSDAIKGIENFFKENQGATDRIIKFLKNIEI